MYKKIILLVCVVVFLFCSGFNFKLENNTDKRVHYNLVWITPRVHLSIMGGELDGMESVTGQAGWDAGHYYIYWSDPKSEWFSRRDLTIDETVTEDCTVEISFNYVPIEITVEK